MISKYKLNLGSFNKCINYLDVGGGSRDFPCSDCTEIHYCMNDVGEIASAKKMGSSICIPTFDIGVAELSRDRRRSQIISDLLVDIELRTFGIIRDMLRSIDLPTTVGNIVILIENIQFFDDDKVDGVYGWAELGIAYFLRETQMTDQLS